MMFGETERFVRRVRFARLESRPGIQTLQRTTVVVPNPELLTL